MSCINDLRATPTLQDILRVNSVGHYMEGIHICYIVAIKNIYNVEAQLLEYGYTGKTKYEDKKYRVYIL